MRAGPAAAWLALVVVLATGALWFRRARAVRLPEDRSAFVLAMAIGALLAVVAFARGPGWWAGAAAGLALAGASLFIGLVAVSAQKGGPGAFRVGAPAPDFSAPDDEGRPFALRSLAGGPILLKFFRGHW